MAAITDPDPLQKTKRSEFQSTPRRHRASLRSSSMLEQAASFRKCGISYGSRAAEDSPGISLPVQRVQRLVPGTSCQATIALSLRGRFATDFGSPNREPRRPRTTGRPGSPTVQQSNRGLSPFGNSPTGGLSPIVLSGGLSPIVLSGGDGRQILNHRGLPLENLFESLKV
jgi:hypothetical protein